MAKACLSLFGLFGLQSSKKPQVVRCPPNEQALADFLEQHEVDTSSWGDGKAKPVASLLRELNEGSCSLRIDQAKKLQRWVEPVFVQITYNGKVLVERMKVFPNGSQRVHATVLAEKKWRDDATTVDAAIRGMREELRVEISKETEGLVHAPLENICFVESMDSASYPGVAAIYDTTFMRFNIQPGSMAERAFSACGLPACKPFETVEQKVEGPLHLCWEWLEFHEALRSGVRGMVPPRDVELKADGKHYLDRPHICPAAGMKAGRVRRKKRRKGEDGGTEEEPPKPRGSHWYIFSLSILLVTSFSFLNFLALPDPRAHSLLSAVLLKRRAAISGDPHSDPAIHGLSDQERVALLKAAEEALQAPLPVVQVDSESIGHAALRGAQSPPVAATMAPTPEPQSSAGSVSALKTLDALRARSKAVFAAVSAPAISGGGMASLSGESWLQLDEAVDADELTFGMWVYVPKVSEMSFPISSESMKTIAATKASGCATSSRGWALFMHEWSTTNRQLRLSWTDGASGCNEIYSDTTVMPYDQWVMTGFTFSKARNRASIMIDKQLIVDTQLGLGKYVRQSKHYPIEEANIHQRALSDSNKLLLGAHLLTKPTDTAMAHGFIGFFGDLRMLKQSIDGSKLVNLLHCDTKDLTSGSQNCGVSTSALHVLVQHQVGEESLNSISGARLQPRYVKGYIPGEGQISSVPVLKWDQKPVHPLVMEPAGAAVDIQTLPGTTLSPEQLRATWPKEWISQYGEEALVKSQQEADGWAAEVRGAMKHTWDGYRSKGWGHDEVQPSSGRTKDWCRMAVTMLDALSTLWIMGLHQEFEEAAKWLESNWLPGPGSHGQHSLFEINIRAFAGLLSSYSLSGKQVFLDTANRLGEKLLGAFTAPSGLPMPTIDIGTGRAEMHKWNSNTVLAEVTTLQVEFRYMSKATGDSRYQEVADKAMQVVLKAAGERGLVPIYLSPPSKSAVSFMGNKISMGAMGDSYYEYLLKLWIQGGKKDAQLKEAWKQAMKEMMDQMVEKTAGGLRFIAELESGRKRNRMDHLACFVAGMLMLGSRSLPPEEVDPRWEPLAADLTYTCYQMYVRTPTGLSPEYVNFNVQSGKGQDMSIPGDAPQNLLRPEAAEAVWHMWYYTGDHKYRQWGHEMFLPFLKYSKVKFGFSAVSDVRKKTAPKRDSQESFWLGETLKYFYLIFAPRNTVNLEEFVLNTEAQPLRVFQ